MAPGLGARARGLEAKAKFSTAVSTSNMDSAQHALESDLGLMAPGSRWSELAAS